MANADWDCVVADGIAARHHLHRGPELAHHEVQTAAFIRSRLDALGIPWQACARTGTLGRLAATARGPHIALRGDIDALPIHECTGKPYASTIAGAMHACGHDGHTATLLTAAAWLKAREDRLPGPVTLLFQPAEEGGHGALRMIEDGALAGIDCIYGWHNWPALPFATALCPDGPIMGANGAFRIVVNGQGGHASQPEACRDPILAIAALTLSLQQIVSRRLPPQEAVVVGVSGLQAPSGPTIIPDRAELVGTVRCARSSLRGQVYDLIRDIAEHSAAAYGCAAQVECEDFYGATVNHAQPAAAYRAAIAAELGAQWEGRSIAVPIMGSEDFSYYLERIPGAFALIGADDGNNHHLPCHNAAYDFNDNLIPIVARIYARLVGMDPDQR